MKAVFLLRKKTAFTQASLFIFGRQTDVTILTENTLDITNPHDQIDPPDLKRILFNNTAANSCFQAVLTQQPIGSWTYDVQAQISKVCRRGLQKIEYSMP